MKLSILVCSVTNRVSNFLPNIINKLSEQSEMYGDVEILCLMDNKKIMLGEKRNLLVKMATGDYVVFVDDDDNISDDYVKSLRDACNYGADIITFIADVTINGGAVKKCYYQNSYTGDFDKVDSYHRIPNHICCVKIEHALATPYENKLYGEDAAYGKQLHDKLKTEFHLDKVLYFYNFNVNTTETQKHLKNVNRHNNFEQRR